MMVDMAVIGDSMAGWESLATISTPSRARGMVERDINKLAGEDIIGYD